PSSKTKQSHRTVTLLEHPGRQVDAAADTDVLLHRRQGIRHGDDAALGLLHRLFAEGLGTLGCFLGRHLPSFSSPNSGRFLTIPIVTGICDWKNGWLGSRSQA